MLLASALLAAQTGGGIPSLPTRIDQPELLDPGLHGGRINGVRDTGFCDEVDCNFPGSFDGSGDLTPDGRVLVSFRKQEFTLGSGDFRWAVVASTLDPDRVRRDVNGQLVGFYEEQDVGSPSDTSYGTRGAFSPLDEAYVLYWAPALRACIPHVSGCLPCGYQPDPDYPNPNESKVSNVTLALRPLDPGLAHSGENPYPSDANGAFQINGSFRTYELWMVTEDWDTAWLCHGVDDVVSVPGSSGTPPKPHLAGMNLRIVVNLAHLDGSGLVHPIIHSATTEPFQRLRTGPTGEGESMVGMETSITADGTLILYHGDGGNNDLIESRLTYSWNPTPCSPTGWSAPRSITNVPPAEFLPDASNRLVKFGRLYGFAKYPIREPDNEVYQATERFWGAYPWVSKDGSFFVLPHTLATEVPAGMEHLLRCGLSVCGDITGGYVKHIDDAALNPTRHGGDMYWPQPLASSSAAFHMSDTGRTTVFSTGLKPGLWEPLLGDDVPIPNQPSSLRIPVLPLFVFRTREYGEVRFEEADGNYLLYLACNESFRHASPSTEPREMHPDETPDTSGRTPRAICTLNKQAGFPQDVVASAMTVRNFVGNAIGAQNKRLHENLGFKGQAISFSSEGNVEVEDDLGGGQGSGSFTMLYGQELSLQTFVKVVVSSISTNLTLIEHPGRFKLVLKPQGRILASVTLASGQNQQVQSAINGVPFGSNGADPGAGWRHVAVTYDGDVNGNSQLRLYLDGQLILTNQWSGTSSLGNAGAASPLYVGPGRGSPASDLTLSEVVLILDEVAVSDIARGEAELRRDAYVAPPASAFEAWPVGQVPLPPALDPAEAEWPKGVAFAQAKVDLGRALFDSELLSADGIGRDCKHCHVPALAYTDGNDRAQDVASNDLPFNTPTLLNAGFGTHKLFDGSASNLEAQVIRPILSGSEMGVQTMAQVKARIENAPDQTLNGLFMTAYNRPFDQAGLQEALAMYLRADSDFHSGDSPFDQDAAARGGDGSTPLDAPELQGRALFFGKARCFACHRGTNLSDDLFHNIHTVDALEDLDGTPGAAPYLLPGRGTFTGRTNEIGQVKTPTLRNVGQTGPYFHDGSALELSDVIEHYNGAFADAGGLGLLDRDIRPLGLTDPEKTALEAFLRTLTTP